MLQEQKKKLSNSLFSEEEEGVAVLNAESLLELFS
jgi:SNF2 family DNA or RNA helicase